MRTETDLYEEIAQHMRLKHPGVTFHFDLSGLWTPSHKLRNLYGRLNERAWPDLFIASPYAYERARDGFTDFAGMFLELKREGTQLKRTKDLTRVLKKDYKIRKAGDWWDLHTEEQAAVLDQLAEQGYIAQFAVGFDEATALIDSYLGTAV